MARGSGLRSEFAGRLRIHLTLAAAVLLATATAALADATVFAGAISGSDRPVIGGSLGFFPRQTGSVIGFEIDHTRSLGAATLSHPRVKSTGVNLLVQVHVVPRRVQVYGALGGGYFSSETSNSDQSGFASNIGGGVKISLTGPLKVRLDYRVFSLSQDPDQTLEVLSYTHPQRVTAGVALAF